MSKCKLSEVSKSISSGITPLRSNTEYWVKGTIPWLKTEQLGTKYIFDTYEKITSCAVEKTNIKINPANTISIAMYGEGRTRGNVSILKNKMATNQACCNVYLDNNKADHEYVYYYLKTQYYQLRNLSSGIRKNLNSNDIKNFEIRLPQKVLEQKKIAAVLSALDAKIEFNNRINAELEAMAKTLYDYWFVQFDFPDKNGKPYKSSGGKMVWNAELKREVPEGWGVNSLSHHLDCNVNTIKKIDKYDVIQYLDTSNITENIIDLIQELNCREGNIPSRAQRIVKKNDLLFSTVRPNQHHFGIIKQPVKNMIASTGFAILSSKVNTTYNDLFYMFITSSANLKKLEKIATSSVSSYPSINPDDILDLKIALPKNPNDLECLYKKFDSIFSVITTKQSENKELSSLRDWLLPMLMNGQVKVK